VDTSAAIATEGLTKRFGKVEAVVDLTLEVDRGEVFGFLGPNGAGKSTTLRLLLGLIRPSAGRAWIMGNDIGSVAARRHLAYVPGDVSLWPRLTGAECLELFADLHGYTDRSLRDELIHRFELDTSVRGRAYSKGNRQKVALVAAFATRADVLLLDEPTTGLDPLMEREFRECVGEAARRGATVFLSSHILGEVEDLCSRVGIIRSGRLVEVAGIDDLRKLRNAEIDVDFDGPPPDLRGVTGITAVEPTPTGLRLHFQGNPGPLLLALVAAKVTNIRSREASLEDIFLTYYGDDDHRRDGDEDDPSSASGADGER
jgi:ABC-2 type transport system ATP-binding protein